MGVLSLFDWRWAKLKRPDRDGKLATERFHI
jgi:hypothetical protein